MDADTDTERMAEIGRAVVDWAMSGDPAAAAEATACTVVKYLDRLRLEKRTLENSKALRVGRIMLVLGDEMFGEPARRTG